MTENKCLCGTNDIRKFKTFGKRDLYQCNKCGSLSILPYPFVSELSAFDFYQKENYLEKINEDEYFGYFKVIESEIESLKINLNSKILDYGCGYGFLVKFLRLAGYKNSFGFEINKNLVKKAFDRFDHNFIFSEEVELQSQKFDLVIMNMVLEHVLNPYHYVNNIVFDILNKNGVLIITVPNMNSLNRFCLKERAGAKPLIYSILLQDFANTHHTPSHANTNPVGL